MGEYNGPSADPFRFLVDSSSIMGRGFCYVRLPVDALGWIAGAIENLRWPDVYQGGMSNIAQVNQEWAQVLYDLMFCADCADDQEITAEELAACSGGLIVLGDDDMGQVVTDTYIDTETGELVVEFGPCCVRRFSLSGLSGGTQPPTEEDPPEVDPPDEMLEGNACSKAYAAWYVISTTVEQLLTDVGLGLTPFFAIKNVQSLWPNIDWGTLRLWNGFIAAATIGLALGDEETQAPAVQNDVRCAIASAMTDGAYGATSAEYDAAKAAVRKAMNSRFTVISNPLIFEAQAQIWTYVMAAIGPKDFEAITANTIPDPLATCDSCGGGTGIDPDGVVVFEGIMTEVSNDDRVSDFVAVNSKTVQFTFQNDGTENYVDLGFKLPLAASETVRQLEVKFTRLDAPQSDLPTAAWQETYPTSSEYYQFDCSHSPLLSDYYGFPGESRMVFTWIADTDLDDGWIYVGGMRMYPSLDCPLDKSMRLQMQITYSGAQRS